jgi:hypothetical protein
MIRILTSNRQNAKERRMRRRVYEHKGTIRVIARRVSYPAAVREVRQCRALRPDCRFLYLPSAGDGYNVVELEGRS